MLFVKFFASVSSSVPSVVEEAVFGAVIKDDLDSGATCEFDLPTVPWIRQFMAVEIVEASGGTDSTVFRGYVHNPVFKTDRISFLCKDFKALMAKKLVLTDKTFSSVSAQSAVDSIISEWNSAYSESWTASVETTAQTVTKDVSRGDDWKGAFDEIFSLVGLKWTVTGTEIRAAATIGTDRTSGESYVELSYDGNSHSDDNVASFEIESFGTLSNVVIGEAGGSKTTVSDSASVAAFGPLGEYKSFRTWDLAAQSAAYLAESKVEQKSISVNIETGRVDADVGDYVLLRIANVSEYADFEGPVTVLRKETRFASGGKTVTLGVWDSNVKVASFGARFALVESWIKKLSL